ncbi:hypothetical protein H9L39_04362, partial [Fusarium oxysporum f. sp. albedinis]
KELKPNMPCTDAALCTAQPHVGESTVICNLAVTFEDQDVPSSSEDDPVAAETEVIVGGGSKARPVQPSSTQPKAEQRYAAEAQHGVGQSSRRSEAHQPPCNSMNPWGTGTFAYCSLCGSLVSSLAHVAPCGLQSQISGIQIESSPTYAA